MPSSTLTATATQAQQATVVVYRQASPELGPSQRIPMGEPRPEGNRRLIPNPSC